MGARRGGLPGGVLVRSTTVTSSSLITTEPICSVRVTRTLSSAVGQSTVEVEGGGGQRLVSRPLSRSEAQTAFGAAVRWWRGRCSLPEAAAPLALGVGS